MSASINLDTLRSMVPAGLPLSLLGIVATVLVGVIYSVIARERPLAGFPLASLEGKGPKKSWTFHGQELVAEAVKKYAGPFQIMSGSGPKIILPNRFADEIRNNPDLNFNKAFAKDFPIDYPGFEPTRQGLKDDSLMVETVRVKLTQSLNLVTDDLVEETTDCLHDIYGEDEQWQTIVLKNTVLDLVARLSSRVFLGKELCRNERWLDIAKNYTVNSFTTAFIMKATPSFLRPIAYWLMPTSSYCRKAVRDAHTLIDGESKRRVEAVEKLMAEGKKPRKTADAIGWMREVSRGRQVDFVAAQLSLSMAAIHTTSETTVQALFDICEHSEIIPQLREEIIQVVGEHGWAKTSLYKLKLMDSFLKESQRIRPMSMVSMNRYVEKDMKLSDGTALPKASRISVLSDFMNPEIYPEPEKFDPARFMKLRQQPGNENGWQFVATSSEHMLFGHGQHACPGRFFASNEIKIALCHLLLKYDWRFLPGESRPEDGVMEAGRMVSTAGKVQYRRRKEEINLDLAK